MAYLRSKIISSHRRQARRFLFVILSIDMKQTGSKNKKQLKSYTYKFMKKKSQKSCPNKTSTASKLTNMNESELNTLTLDSMHIP